jgi:endonuclease/exonuclease/phosphatase family metal-dependent hydrolase
VLHFVLLLQEATRRDRAVPARVPRGYPAPRAITARHGSRDADVRRFADAGYAVLYAPSMRNGGRLAGADESAEDRGNAIVSTLPLTDPRLIELPLERQRRVAAAAAIGGHTTSGARWRLDLVNVHLDTALALFHGGPFAARRRQAAALIDALSALDRNPGSDAAMVVAGDLNTWRGDGEAAVGALKDAFPGTPAAARAPTWRGPLGLHATLDHIFVRGAVSASPVVRLPGRFGSDHYPLLTVLHLRLD